MNLYKYGQGLVSTVFKSSRKRWGGRKCWGGRKYGGWRMVVAYKTEKGK